MKVSKEVKKVWVRQIEYGDIVQLQSGLEEKGIKISTNTLSTAINTGSCSESTFKYINDFIIQKIEKKKQEESNFLAKVQ